MHIALIIENFDPAAGGAERNCVSLAKHLQQRGHTVTILCGGCSNDQTDLTLEPGSAGKPRTSLQMLRFVRWADRRLRDSSFDVSISFNMTVAATILQPRGGSIHETLRRNVAMRPTPTARFVKRFSLALSPKQHLLRHLEKKTLIHPRVRCIAVLSDYVARQFRSLGVSDDRLRLIHNAVDMPPIDAIQKQQWRNTLREQFHIGRDATAYLFAAYNPRLKGIEPLMHALKQVIHNGTDAVLLLAGGVGYAEQVLAERIGVRDRVRFIGRTMNMPAVYAMADVTVHPTYYDPSSRVVIESLLMGRPAITTSYNGAGDFIIREDGRLAGRVIKEPDDVTALATAMIELADPAERKRCREATQGLAEYLSMNRHVDQLEALLKEMARP